jgi:succinate dehydrogenase/fumarate reductase flavoprotein subunit
LIALATYDGKVVADGVARDLPTLSTGYLASQDVEQESRRLNDLRNCSGDGPTPAKVKERIRALMWEKVGVEKSAAGMRAALDDIEQIRSDILQGMRIANSGGIANYEWLDAIDVINMIDACELIVHSSLERKESRGPFFRQDFPLTDNANWLAANVLKRSGNGIRFERRPYDLPTFRPDFVTKDNLEVAW